MNLKPHITKPGKVATFVRTATIALFLVLSTFGFGQTQIAEMDEGEQHAIAELRFVADMIKGCSPLNLPLSPLMESEGFADVYEPPGNLVWDVEAQPSARARYTGIIEFNEPHYFQVPLSDSYCSKPHIDKKECRRMWNVGRQIWREEVDHPFQFRYEFDVSSRGLEFLRAFKKTHQTEDEPWVPGGINSDGCAAKAIDALMKRANATQ